MTATLKKLFDPSDGDWTRELPDGTFAVWVSYAHDEPIVVSSRTLADQIAKAIQEAHTSGVSSGDREY